MTRLAICAIIQLGLLLAMVHVTMADDDVGTIVISKDLTDVKVKGDVVARLGIGTIAWATTFSPDKKWVWVKVPGASVFGWIRATDARNFAPQQEHQATWDNMLKTFSQSDAAAAAGDAKKSESLAREALSLAESIMPPRYPGFANLHMNLAQALWRRNRLDEARRYFRLALETFRYFKGDKHAETIDCCISLASAEQDLENNAIAANLFLFAVQEFRARGKQLSDATQHRYAVCLRDADRIQPADEESERLLENRRQRNASAEEIHAALQLRYDALVRNGKYKAAEKAARELLKLTTESDDGQPETSLGPRNALAAILIRQDRNVEAAVLLREALPDAAKAETPNSSARCNLALALAKQGAFEESEELLDQLEDGPGVNNQFLMGFIEKNRGVVALGQKELERAEEHLQRALTIHDSLSANSRHAMDVRVLLADVAKADGDIELEATLLQQTLAIAHKIFGASHAESMKLLQRTTTAVEEVDGVAAAERLRSEFTSSEPPRRRTLDDIMGKPTYAPPAEPIGIGEVTVIRSGLTVRVDDGRSFSANIGNSFWVLEKTQGEYRVALAGSDASINASGVRFVNPVSRDQKIQQIHRLGELVGAYQQGNRLRIALSIAQKRLELLGEVGAVDDSYVNLIVDMSILLNLLGEYDRSLGWLDVAMPLVSDQHGRGSAEYLKLVTQMGITLQNAGRPGRALPHLRRSVEFFSDRHGELHEQTIDSRNAYGLCLSAVGQHAEAEAQLKIAARSSTDKRGRAHFQTLDVRQNQALVTMELGQLDVARSLFEAALEDAQKNAEAASVLHLILGNLCLLTFKQGDPIASREFGEQALNAAQAAGMSETPQYSRLLTNLGMACQQLGDFDRAIALFSEGLERNKRFFGEVHIDTAAVQSTLAAALPMRATISKIELIREEGDVKAAEAVVNALRPLSEILLRPILESETAAKNVVISPDGALWLVPWQALILDDGRYLVEEYTLRTVTSGRSLGWRKSGSSSQNAAIFADCDFGKVSSSSTKSDWRELPEFGRLPGTAAEANAITGIVGKLVDGEVSIFTGKQATEEQVATLSSPEILVLSTHGFLLPEQTYRPTETVFAEAMRIMHGSTGNGRSPNPYQRTGLVLANANDRQSPRQPDSDGILTGEEIAQLKLADTDLVVLSACESGLGDITNGEGVAGLRQAFHLAGVQSVSTLWQIEDLETSRLMTDFLRNLADGKKKSEAL